MCDFDLSQALDSSSDSDETGCESRCFNMTEVQEEIIRLNEGLDLVVSQNQKTLKSVTTLLMVVNRMNRSLARCGWGLSDGELCSAIMESLVTETIITMTESSSADLKRRFRRISSWEVCTLCDTSQKEVVQASGDIKLQAITLKGGNCERKVSFKVARYLNPSVPPGDVLTVLLSITNNQHICCSMEDGQAVLKLEECCKQKLQNISADEDMDRFLFYKRTEGVSLNTFESVKCGGWFISTSCQGENQPVEMCRRVEVDAARRLNSFKLN
ncbi:interleukin-1 beta [Anarrhichthys ocellatus]|uniref:interleukin-1 beta n=1 Tax=Anarrhichthys ocellatus TaxID=433405 RepID=UPI0012EDF2DD|nr:interleukin-1 beta-like [Anarrhichthys ocellatus]